MDNELIDQLRDSYSRIAFEKESLKSALFNGQILKYNDTDETPLALAQLNTIQNVSLTSLFKQIEFNHSDKFKKNFSITEAIILKNGDLLISGFFEDPSPEYFRDTVLFIIYLNKKVLKRIKEIEQKDYCSMKCFNDKICLVYKEPYEHEWSETDLHNTNYCTVEIFDVNLETILKVDRKMNCHFCSLQAIAITKMVKILC